jgi:hypothetical protein
MRILLPFVLLSLLAPASVAQDENVSPDTTWQVFESGTISLPDVRETSPSITADGQTMVFARTENWNDKVPCIATRTGDRWSVRTAPFADTLYNLAIAPDGQSIFFKKNETQDGEDVSPAYRVARTSDGWGEPQSLPALQHRRGVLLPDGRRHALLLRPVAPPRHLPGRADP